MENSLPREERLHSRKSIQELFRQGRWLRSEHVQMVFMQVAKEDPLVRVMFSAPKKRFKKAVDRNLLKRQMREVYRNEKSRFFAAMEKHGSGLRLGFVYQASEMVAFNTIKDEMIRLLTRLSKRLEEPVKAT